MTAVIFVSDILTPLWYDVWVLYLIPLFFMYQFTKRPYAYSAVVILLVVAGSFLSPSNNTPLTHSLINRLTGILGGWRGIVSPHADQTLAGVTAPKPKRT